MKPIWQRFFRPPVKFVWTRQFSEQGALSPDEELYLSSAVSQRRREFVTGRRCAMSAMELLGVRVSSVGRRADRLPNWPEAVIGSITHCDGFCAAAVAPREQTRFLGIDVEPNAPLPDGVLQRIGSRREIKAVKLARSESSPRQFFDRILFSAKECAFKALYPVVGIYFDFDEVELNFDAELGQFSASLSASLRELAGVAQLNGRFVTTPNHTITLVHVAIEDGS